MNVVEQVAELMRVAARTAPKARGIDLLEIKVIKGETIKKLSKKMLQIGKAANNNTFLRDGENILKAEAIVLLGTVSRYLGLRLCGYCGYANCAEAEKAKLMCALNTGDLGIAIGSAVSVAMDHRIDNRVMYSVGKTALEMGLLGKEVVAAYGVPLSATGKNPFFDRD
ncbi:ferredoxin [candidate division WOR-1 bacterium RIFCSPLOWO2_02_FULL_46_20]|uniref:Ferredoxin n=2 Tax=Saganbacteria TaxID=1703751 RepID=A0A1F4R8V3_UNCSA|nr:MAG: ferredoxin [candidate division WOR-1 bacterium RIFCSPHIGHO2_02_FULL_45_12]OGC04614.1 MAG: ferredoxin [candidate division WOR-1 bacterium RIFCSPLOWO2_02_FULL_46_20]OGC08863.1 MAG: ferredoxin [candidate division WOR-1 bacterium RIFCSPLOWO2_12_FULL_45_9]